MTNQGDQFLERASLLLEQGRGKDAENYIRQALSTDPENDYALALLCRSLYAQKRYKEGIEAILQAIGFEPEESFYFYLLAFGYYQTDKAFEALSNLDKAIEIFPYNAEYFGLMSFILVDEKRYDEALAKANEGLAIDAESSTCLNARARALNRLKRTDEAEETIADSLSKEPDSEITHATIGWNYLERGLHKKANHHFREALRLSPDYSSARIGLKESLKSIFLPYKWIMLFNLWLSEKGKSFQWIFIIGMLVVTRILRSIATNNESSRIIIFPIIALYFVFIAFSWIANPLANFFLLFHKDGRYSLTKSEKIIGIAVVSCIVTGLSLVALAYVNGADKSENILFAGIALATIAVPLGQMNLPVDLKSKSAKVWYPFSLLVTGLLSALLLIINIEAGWYVLIIYAIALFIFQWVANAWAIGR
ncbi:MAG: tetratricopeptide repeat protein [Chitinophagaceae bacterium]|nr:tetratricopeptide repeat protein [Chitinophagaceae bacterium]